MFNPPKQSEIDRGGSPERSRRYPSGFALVVTLSLMILLTIVAVGLLSLSAISLRGTSQAQARSEAQANARLALMMAIGELQKQLGPDQRISANGAILSDSTVKHPHWTGVWNSWKAGTGEASQHSTIAGVSDQMAPTYQANRSDYFRSWLLSLDPAEAVNVQSARTLALTGSRMPAANATAVELVGTGSLGSSANAADFVSARLLKVMPAATGGPARGRYGWWIGDESQKARIMDDSYAVPGQSLTMAERIFRQQAPGSMGTSSIKGLENLTNDSQLDSLPSLATLDLVSQVTGRPAQENFHSATPYSYQLLADVREGGLKRDLSTLLERPISIDETQDQYMLYRFDTQGQERVPIQDLAAYYQMYDSTRDPNKAKGIRYTSSPQNNLLPSGIQVAAPDYYTGKSQDSFKREYTNLYRSPVPIKIQMVLAASAEQISPGNFGLRLGLAPVVTLWNPNNVPIVMNAGDPAILAQQMRFNYLPFMINWNRGGFINPVSIAYAAMGGDGKTGKPGWSSSGNIIKASIFDMYFSSDQSTIVFEPGETRVFSYPFMAGNFSFKKHWQDQYQAHQQATYGWKSELLRMPFSAWDLNNNPANVSNGLLVIRNTDSLSFTINTEKDIGVDWTRDQEAAGAGINFMMIQKIHQSRAAGLPGDHWFYRNYQLCSRTGSNTVDFNDSLIRKGFGSIQKSLNPSAMIASPGKWFPMLQFALMAGCEASEATAGVFAGRKFASRPYLHSTPLAPPSIDKDDDASLYNIGWNWWVETINSFEQAEVGVAPNSRSGYYGGGYNSYRGSTHVIQQDIPVVSPMSIAALSHAHLGGFSLSGVVPNVDNPVCTATGYGGLFPHTLQAIGNSYAHPLIPADKASTSWSRQFNSSGPKTVTLADHSYLANKALWDEFFFSSITPQPSEVKVFETATNQSPREIAREFFLDVPPKPLPNRRIVAYKGDLNKNKLDSLFTSAEQQKFSDGLADKIGAHLMVEGPFNVNSTSVDAWKTLLHSLKGKPVAYLDKATTSVKLGQVTPSGTPVGPGSLPNGTPITSDSITGPNTPTEQWSSWRELSDKEIDELATAIIKQVKLRGPFLSLSEFVNRRLDSGNEDLAVKGALQAALDDPVVSINKAFRNTSREFSADEINAVSPVFRKAMEGPVAYGSAAYVDQADVLRNFAAQLTPRGDTFVIRTYGDAIDGSGNVVARAWCEAVVQRLPEYADPTDEPHVKQANLRSTANKQFGRKLQIVTFRWLGSSEV